MADKKTLLFFECLGEIFRDITTIEFLMRCAIAKKDGDINKLPKPPYTKNKIYIDYPNSFSYSSFEIIVNKFNKRFPEIQIPKELIELRHAMAHGLISEINKSGITEIIKFKELENKQGLRVEFNVTLELDRLIKIKESLKNLRWHLMQVAKDKA